MLRGDRRMGLLALVTVLTWAASASAQVSLIGDWADATHEFPKTNAGVYVGDFLGLPVTAAALAAADAYDEGIWSEPEQQCVPDSPEWGIRELGVLRIWEETDPVSGDLVAIRMFIALFAQTRTIWMDGRPHPGKYAPHTWQGFSTGRWEGNQLTVTTTHLKQFNHRHNGVPASDEMTLVEHFIRHGDKYLTHIAEVYDPLYLTRPLILSEQRVLRPNVAPTAYQYDRTCQPDTQISGHERGYVPHNLPGTTPDFEEFAHTFHIPWVSTRAGAEALFPEYRSQLKKLLQGPNPFDAPKGANALTGPPAAPTGTDLGGAERYRAAAAQYRRGVQRDTAAEEVEIVRVAENVYMIGGAGANVTVQLGSGGVWVVDAGSEQMSAKTLAAIRRITDKPIRYIVNTSADFDHVGGNVALNKVAAAIRTRESLVRSGAVVIAHENVLRRMSAPTGQKAPTPVEAWPTATYFTPSKSVYFNGEGIRITHMPAAHSDGDSLVHFRGSDVIAAGDVFDKTRYPVIDLARGGSVNGVIEALNALLDLMIPGESAEGGTMVVPGHGQVCDKADVFEYRNMVTIVRDRVQDMLKKGMTLEQVKAARPTREYDPRYGDTSGPWTTDLFVEAVYRSLSDKRS